MTEKQQQQHSMPAVGLNELDQVQLNPALDGVFLNAQAGCAGTPEWRSRKLHQGREILALSQIAPRFSVIKLDLRENLRALAFMRVPVPIDPGESNELRTAPYAVLGFTYPENAVVEPLPGYEFVQILQPEDVYHPNVADQAGGQALCLGPAMPAGIRIKEIVLLTYGALSMQSFMMDERDPAGLMNLAAAKWWQTQIHQAPLSREPFLAAGDGYLARSHEEKAANHA